MVKHTGIFIMYHVYYNFCVSSTMGCLDKKKFKISLRKISHAASKEFIEKLFERSRNSAKIYLNLSTAEIQCTSFFRSKRLIFWPPGDKDCLLLLWPYLAYHYQEEYFITAVNSAWVDSTLNINILFFYYN